MMEKLFHTHPLRKENGKYKTLPLCKTKVGCYCCCRGKTRSDLADLGIGITVYFKMLKFLMCLYLWMAFLSIPAYYFYYTGNESGIKETSLKYALSVFSLGNIG